MIISFRKRTSLIVSTALLLALVFAGCASRRVTMQPPSACDRGQFLAIRDEMNLDKLEQCIPNMSWEEEFDAP